MSGSPRDEDAPAAGDFCAEGDSPAEGDHHTEGADYVVVGRLRKPHGLKGEFTLFPLTDAPEETLAEGREVWVLGLDGEIVAGPLRLERSRGYHREWLVKFAGLDARGPVEPWRGRFLGVPAGTLPGPAEDEVYLGELAGFSVRLPDGTALGLVSAVYELPAGITIEVQGPKREFLLPFRKEFVQRIERGARRLVVTPPDGLVEG